MKFTYEKLTEEKRQEISKKYPFTHPMSQMIHGPIVIGNRALADDGTTFIAELGDDMLARVNNYLTHFFALVWHDQVINIEVRFVQDKSTRVCTRYVMSIHAPSSLKQEEHKIEALVKDAIDDVWNFPEASELKYEQMITIQFFDVGESDRRALWGHGRPIRPFVPQANDATGIDEKATAELDAKIKAIYVSSDDPLERKKQFLAADRDTRTVAAGVSIFQNLAKKMHETDPNGVVHIPELFSILGSLAGYSCQASMREEFAKKRGVSEREVFTGVETKDGRTFFYGDTVNKALVEWIWPKTEAVIKQLGGTPALNQDEVFGHVASTLGTKDFGVLRVPAGYRPLEATPDRYAAILWSDYLRALELYTGDPFEWPMIFTVAIQDALQTYKGDLESSIAETLILESAVIASKIDAKTPRYATTTHDGFNGSGQNATKKAVTVKSFKDFRQLVAHNYSVWWQDKKKRASGK